MSDTPPHPAPDAEPAFVAPATDAAPDAAPLGVDVPPVVHGCPVDPRSTSRSLVVHCNRDRYVELCRGLKADGYGLPVGVTGVDYLTHPGRDLPAGIT